jgi:hypothetical protein
VEDSMDEERDKYLVETMGGCWHEWDSDKGVNTYSLEAYICDKCKGFILGNRDFSTEEDFNVLLKWARSQPALADLSAEFRDEEDRETGERNSFADALYQRLTQPDVR